MNWLQLYEKGGLPGDVTREMAVALDRRAAGEKLTPKARNRARQALRRIKGERIARHWLTEERMAQHGDGRVGRSGMAEPTARPGGAGPAAPSRAATAGTGMGSPAAGGALALRRSSFDARTCSPQDFTARISGLGLDASFYQQDSCTEDARRTRQSPSLGLLVKQQRAQLDAAKRLAARAAELDAGRINARDASPEQVQARIEQILGANRERTVLDGAFKPAGKPLAPPAPPKISKAQREAQRRDEAILAASKRGTVDARRLSSDAAFRKLLELRGYWAGAL